MPQPCSFTSQSPDTQYFPTTSPNMVFVIDSSINTNNILPSLICHGLRAPDNVMHHRFLICFRSPPPLKIHQFPSLSPGQQHLETLLHMLPKMFRNQPTNHQDSDFWESEVLQPSHTKCWFGVPKESSSRLPIGACPQGAKMVTRPAPQNGGTSLAKMTSFGHLQCPKRARRQRAKLLNKPRCVQFLVPAC